MSVHGFESYRDAEFACDRLPYPIADHLHVVRFTLGLRPIVRRRARDRIPQLLHGLGVMGGELAQGCVP